MNTIKIGVLVWMATGVLTTNSSTFGQGQQNRAETPAFSATINVTDARTKKPVKSIRVVPTPYNERAKQVTWQSQYLKQYASQPAVFEMKRGWKESLLRIEADGYLPYVTKPLAKATDIVLDVALQLDEGIAGRVLTPAGQPAAGASIAVCTWTNEVTVGGGTLKYGHHAERLRGLVQAAADGSFKLPGEVDEWVLVVAHESGYAEPTAAEFASQSTVTLKPWGRLEGTYLPSGKPVAGQPLNIGAGRGDAQVVLHYSAGDTTTDAAGKFTAERLPPVKMFVQPLFKQGESSYSLLWFSGLVEIKSGEVTRIGLPRRGQDVTGKLALPPDSGLNFADLEIDLSVTLRPPRIFGFGGEANQSQVAYGSFMQSEQGASFRREQIPVNADGGFRIEGLPETHYGLRAMAYRKPVRRDAERGEAIASYATRVEVPEKTTDATMVDLGTITLQLRPAAKLKSDFCEDPPAGDPAVEKQIVVDKSKFSDLYPAVWFSPSTGEIAKLTERSEVPPEKKYEIWIEPRDPEFGYNPDQKPKGVGFARVGKGDSAFKAPAIPRNPKLELKITHLMKESKASDNVVYYCKAKESECLIMITKMDSEKEVIAFRWRLLRTAQE